MDEEVGIPIAGGVLICHRGRARRHLGAAWMIHNLTAVALGASAALLTTSAFAQGTGASAPAPAPETTAATPASEPTADSDGGRHPVSVGLLVGFGIGNVFRHPRVYGDVVNPYALGIGLRAGYTLPMNLYLGATFIYHVGYTVPFFGGEARSEVESCRARELIRIDNHNSHRTRTRSRCRWETPRGPGRSRSCTEYQHRRRSDW